MRTYIPGRLNYIKQDIDFMQWFDSIPLSRITHQLFIGGYAQASMLAERNPSGITAVLNVSTEEPYRENKNIIYRHIPFADGHEIPPAAFKQCMEFMTFHYNAGGRILVHCSAGISRSVTITASFMHYSGQMDFNDALELVKRRRPIANPAVVVLTSAKRMLHVWPYDGSMISEPDHVVLVETIVEELTLNDAVKGHPNGECLVRRMLLDPSYLPNAPRHEVKCICDQTILIPK